MLNSFYAKHLTWSGNLYIILIFQFIFLQHSRKLCYCCFFFFLLLFSLSLSFPSFWGFKNFWCKLCFPLYLKRVLLRYHPHTIRFVHLKYAVQWFLVYSQSCVTSTTVNFGTLITSKNKPCTCWQSLPTYPQLLSNASPQQLLICCLSL